MSNSTFATSYLLTVTDSHGDTITSTLTTTGGLTTSTITGITGTFDSSAITGLNNPSTYRSGQSTATFDNKLYPTEAAAKLDGAGPYTAYFDNSGLDFFANGDAIDVYATANNGYVVGVQYANKSYGTYSVTSLSLVPIISAGTTASLTSAATFSGVDSYGTIVLSAALTGAVNMEGNGAHSAIQFASGAAAPVLTNFGTTDELIITGTSIPTGDGVALVYSGGKLIEEVINSSGGVVSSNTVSLAGVSSLSASSFVDLIGTNGVTIELAPTVSTSFTFSTTGTGSLEAPSSYTGRVAPGDVLGGNDTVTIASGTASVSSRGVIDYGTISVKSGSGFIDAGSLTGTGTLAVASGGNASLTGTTNLGTITDAGTLTLGGTNSGPISLASTGTLVLANGVKENGSITGTGTLSIGTGSTVTLGSAATAASVLDNGTLNADGALAALVNMEGNGAETVVDLTGTDFASGKTLATSFTNFGTTDTIVLGAANLSLSGNADHLSETYNAATDQLTITDSTSGTSAVVNLTLTSGDLPGWIRVSEVGGAAELTLCFYPGTRIATPSGEVAVEDLRAGDLVLTVNGAMPVRWMGQSHVHTRFADPLRSLPIRISAGALGEGLPARDLLVSPDHALYLDGLLVQAGALAGLPGISRERDVPVSFTYYHVELSSHELLFAEGALAESFVDNVERMHFQNWDERAAPAEPIVEMEFPRVKSARQLPAVLRRRWAIAQAA